MPKRPDTHETVLLALELLRRIPRNRSVSAPELHRQLAEMGVERDLRTIQRQMDMLSEHFDIERDERSKPYGYRWKERAKGLALPMLSEHESLLLTLAERHLRNLLPASLMKSMEGFFVQARSNLGPGAHAGREREWLSKIRVVSETQPLLPPRIRPGVFEEVSNALYSNRWLNLDYKNAAGKRSTVEVMPLGLAQQGPRLYLVCRYRDFDNERSLALHRIIAAEASTHTFGRPKEFDLQKYDADGRFGFGEASALADLPHHQAGGVAPARVAVVRRSASDWRSVISLRSARRWWIPRNWNGGCGGLGSRFAIFGGGISVDQFGYFSWRPGGTA